MATGHGGNLREIAASAGLAEREILDFSANVNPLGMPEAVRAVISANVEGLGHYPDPDAAGLVAAIARQYRLPREQIVVGNGSSEILFALARALRCKRAVIPVPAYIDYATAAEAGGMKVEWAKLKEEDDFALDWTVLGKKLRGGEVVLLGEPNNPTGLMFDRAKFLRFAAKHRKTMFVVDEAFADFVEGYETLAKENRPNVVVLRSLTKFYAIPGLRLGFASGPVELAEKVRRQICAVGGEYAGAGGGRNGFGG